MFETTEPVRFDRQEKEKLVCTECNKPEHNADSCFRLDVHVHKMLKDRSHGKIMQELHEL